MPKVVEIIGPSGSGKSSIYSMLKEKWDSKDPWVSFDDLKYSHLSPSTLMLRRLNKLFGTLLPFKSKELPNTDMIPEWKLMDHRNKTFLGDEYADIKSVIMDLVEAHAKRAYDGSDKRFNTIYMMMWSIAQIDTLSRRKDDNRFCILRQGEGLISRVMHLNSPTFDENALITYLEAIPMPDVLFALELSTDEIVRRIKSRDRISTLHKGMNDEEIYRYTQSTYNLLQLAADYAKGRGTDVFKVDVSKPVEDSVQTITETLSRLNNEGSTDR